MPKTEIDTSSGDGAGALPWAPAPAGVEDFDSPFKYPKRGRQEGAVKPPPGAIWPLQGTRPRLPECLPRAVSLGRPNSLCRP